ncbi:bacillithiol biosynthesis cysteine-adding enzyme BshC [Salibacteraceae bacterium]|nr:bacillithiol biosynthesis cysteine-adding enzyme BshC [Salibacteraceae bacterium]
MESDCISYKDIDFLSKLMSDYLDNNSSLQSLYGQSASLSGFKKNIEKRQFSQDKRTVLAAALEKQYEGVANAELQLNAISALKQSTTFTVTTGHQLCLGTGPLYFIYKILSVVKLSRQLKKEFPENEFVPIYWMATEDHDFLEINHFNTSNKRYEWEGVNDYAVGWKQPEITELIAELEVDIEKSTSGKKWIELIKEAYSKKDLASATRNLVHNLLGKYGVLVIDGDATQLKQIFAPYVIQEIDEQISFNSVGETIQQLNHIGHKEQVTPRDINLFYLSKTSRIRITKVEEAFELADGSKNWTKDELIKEAVAAPELFSPNVLLRPLYQETILPNLSYTGGAGEMSYWFELKSMFEKFEVNFPILLLRNSAVIVSERDTERLSKLKLNWTDMFKSEISLEKQLVEIHGNTNLNLDEYRSKIESIFLELKALAGSVDKTLEPSSEVSKTRSLQAIDRLEKKLIRGEKLNLETDLEMMYRVKSALFPKGNFQERYYNIAQFYPKTGDALFDKLLEVFEPLHPDITLIEL